MRETTRAINRLKKNKKKRVLYGKISSERELSGQRLQDTKDKVPQKKDPIKLTVGESISGNQHVSCHNSCSFGGATAASSLLKMGGFKMLCASTSIGPQSRQSQFRLRACQNGLELSDIYAAC